MSVALPIPRKVSKQERIDELIYEIDMRSKRYLRGAFENTDLQLDLDSINDMAKELKKVHRSEREYYYM